MDFPLLTSHIAWGEAEESLVIARIITPKSLSFRVFSRQNHQHVTLCRPPLTPIHFKKLSLFHSSLLTSVQPCVKLEYMRLKGSVAGQQSKHTFYRACARPKPLTPRKSNQGTRLAKKRGITLRSTKTWHVQSVLTSAPPTRSYPPSKVATP